jgi:phosphatidylethanolamine/phosphatidyl-N-methylethanolamine N-methyltransferase
MAGEIDIGTVAKAYARWAPVYDLVWGAVFDAGRKASIAAAERIGGRILDVGIGTGISLTDYSAKNRICGVDYSEPMLRKAQEVIAHKLDHVEALAVMDATRPAFAMSASTRSSRNTSSPRCPIGGDLDDFVRVTRVGEIILVKSAPKAGHCGSPSRAAPLARRLGWRPEFRWDAWRNGPSAGGAWSSAARCRRSGCSR